VKRESEGEGRGEKEKEEGGERDKGRNKGREGGRKEAFFFLKKRVLIDVEAERSSIKALAEGYFLLPR
jgi:hypothetical protein